MSKKFVFCIIFVYCANQDFLSSKSVNLLFIGYERFIVLSRSFDAVPDSTLSLTFCWQYCWPYVDK